MKDLTLPTPQQSFKWGSAGLECDSNCLHKTWMTSDAEELPLLPANELIELYETIKSQSADITHQFEQRKCLKFNLIQFIYAVPTVKTALYRKNYLKNVVTTVVLYLYDYDSTSSYKSCRYSICRCSRLQETAWLRACWLRGRNKSWEQTQQDWPCHYHIYTGSRSSHHCDF